MTHNHDANIVLIGHLLIFNRYDKSGVSHYDLREDVKEWLKENKVPFMLDIRTGPGHTKSMITIFDDNSALLFKLTFHDVVPFTA